MIWVFGSVALLLVIVLAVGVFARSDAAGLAEVLRTGLPLGLGAFGLGAILVGGVAIGSVLLFAAACWLVLGRRRRPPPAKRLPPRRRSMVRTAALEMQLDHDTGALEGVVLAGRHEQKMLGRMALRELTEVYADLRSDSESRQLLETYLDGRFPVWRKNADADDGNRQRVAPGAGAMTKQEAYKVLGLEAGATPADIRKAHRRLMQRLSPEIGRPSVLAARINEAKDVLLTNHD